MICQDCNKPMFKMCEDCGIFFEEPEYEVSDLSTFNVKHKRDYKKLDRFKEVLNQLQAKEDKTLPPEVLTIVRDNLPIMMETVSGLTGVELTWIILRKSKRSKHNENAKLSWSMASGRQPP